MIRKILISILLVSFLSACTSLQNINNDFAHVAIGDTVDLKTKSGKSYNFIVESITTEQISGEGFSFLLSEISEIKKEQISVVKTTLIVITTLLVIFIGSFGSSSF